MISSNLYTSHIECIPLKSIFIRKAFLFAHGYCFLMNKCQYQASMEVYRDATLKLQLKLFVEIYHMNDCGFAAKKKKSPFILACVGYVIILQVNRFLNSQYLIMLFNSL